MTEQQLTDDTDLAEGFETEAPQQTLKLEPKPKIEPKPKAAKPQAQAEFVQITREQFNSLEAAAKKVTDIEGQLSKAFGTIGNVQQTVNKLSQGVSPVTAELVKEAYADMANEFPELAGHHSKALEKIFSKVRAANASGEPVDHKAVQKLVQDQALAYQVEALNDAYSDWREIVGAVDSDGRHDGKNPFRQWLTKQPIGYQHKVNATNSAAVIERAIDRFRKDTAVRSAPQPTPKIPPKAARRLERVRGAIQPRGDGGMPRPSSNANDEFSQGFSEG